MAPHFTPSNLAAVHRSRLFAQHLPTLGWEPIIVTVDYHHYEEEPDWELHQLVDKELRIEAVNAISTKRVRLIGDLGIRGFIPMLRRIIQLIRKEDIQFLYIPIPSHFAALLGRLAHRATGVSYGIDYIDPWVHQWPGTERKFSKHWWSMKLGEWMEPIAVKKACLITGVAPKYYEAVLQRNPLLKETVVTAAMPYGGEARDHDFIRKHETLPYLFQKQTGIIDLVYAGAMLPKAYGPLRAALSAIATNRDNFKNIRIHFIGTGKSPNNPTGYNIKPIAEEFGLYGEVIFEYPKRIAYLDVLTHLNAADGIFILGSTEPHYTPSKVFQGVLSEKPIFAVLHQDCTAKSVLEASGAGITLAFDGELGIDKIKKTFTASFMAYLDWATRFSPLDINHRAFDEYSAYNTTKILATALDTIADSKNGQ